MTVETWEYFGRRGPEGDVYELYRMPPLGDPLARFAAKQRLRKGFFWLDDGDDPALSNEWYSGWFDFDDDRLSEEQVGKIITEWMNRPDWPGRP